MTLCCLQLLCLYSRDVKGDIVLFTAVCLYSRYVKGDIVLFAAVVVVFQICEG